MMWHFGDLFIQCYNQYTLLLHSTDILT